MRPLQRAQANHSYSREGYLMKQKTTAYLNFNLDVFARPMKLIFNDEVTDLKEAQQVLRQFMLVKDDKGEQNGSR